MKLKLIKAIVVRIKESWLSGINIHL